MRGRPWVKTKNGWSVPTSMFGKTYYGWKELLTGWVRDDSTWVQYWPYYNTPVWAEVQTDYRQYPKGLRRGGSSLGEVVYMGYFGWGMNMFTTKGSSESSVQANVYANGLYLSAFGDGYVLTSADPTLVRSKWKYRLMRGGVPLSAQLEDGSFIFVVYGSPTYSRWNKVSDLDSEIYTLLRIPDPGDLPVVGSPSGLVLWHSTVAGGVLGTDGVNLLDFGPGPRVEWLPGPSGWFGFDLSNTLWFTDSFVAYTQIPSPDGYNLIAHAGNTLVLSSTSQVPVYTTDLGHSWFVVPGGNEAREVISSWDGLTCIAASNSNGRFDVVISNPTAPVAPVIRELEV